MLEGFFQSYPFGGCQNISGAKLPACGKRNNSRKKKKGRKRRRRQTCSRNNRRSVLSGTPACNLPQRRPSSLRIPCRKPNCFLRRTITKDFTGKSTGLSVKPSPENSTFRPVN